ncbi:DUF6412 domain-containing protein [Microbacterium sp. NPDC008134]|uniref:DUF6412 domain-containing protein n=1 Tax=Microbacterium sp. NPDC008134 TaxID=3364183 RepID=UPI0036E8D2DB
MGEWIERMLSALLATLGLVVVSDAAALGVAIALIAVTALVLAVALSIRTTVDTRSPHPWRAIDASALLAQSDPDAAGHPRPRAPGVAISA